MKRMVRVGKWSGSPSADAKACAAVYVKDYFQTEQVWTRREHGAFVVAVRENAKNTEKVEEFRFNRSMEERFQFRENEKGEVEVELVPQ